MLPSGRVNPLYLSKVQSKFTPFDGIQNDSVKGDLL